MLRVQGVQRALAAQIQGPTDRVALCL
jgi:hypothetical protein